MARGFGASPLGTTPKGKWTAMPPAAHPQGFNPLRPNRVTARLSPSPALPAWRSPEPCPYPKYYIPSVKML